LEKPPNFSIDSSSDRRAESVFVILTIVEVNPQNMIDAVAELTGSTEYKFQRTKSDRAGLTNTPGQLYYLLLRERLL
jgi:hypothetical protein